VKRATFLAFVAPSMTVMLLFIALPLLGVAYQSLVNRERIYRQQSIEDCTPGFPNPVCTKTQASMPVLGPDGQPRTQTVFVGLGNFRAVLQPAAIATAFAPGGGGLPAVLQIDFYKALLFTLVFTLATLPLVVGIGLALALALNNTMRALRGPIIFVSLLPFIITPVIGALSIRWLFAGDGILTAVLEHLLGQPLAPLANSWSLQALMMAYRVWNTAPFAFIVFYAGLQTINLDSLAAAVMDGASRLQRRGSFRCNGSPSIC
jgi:multiple sugar transport system permease protein